MPLDALTSAYLQQLRMKVCLVGESGVGKSSLIHRFVVDDFSDRYIITMGAKVSSKSFNLALSTPPREFKIDMTIWDIMGAKGFRELLKEAYFFQAQGVLAVCDVTRRDTLEELLGWQEAVRGVSGWVPMVVLANKTDLPNAEVAQRDLEVFCSPKGWPFVLTSAKTGHNVEEAFRTIARLYLESIAG